jgi:hypothetical protein
LDILFQIDPDMLEFSIVNLSIFFHNPVFIISETNLWVGLTVWQGRLEFV